MGHQLDGTPGPSRMELAGWGLAGLVPLALIHQSGGGDTPLMILGWLSIFAGISVAAGRVMGIWQAGAGLFAVLFIVSCLLVFLTSGVWVDGRRLPLLVDLLPAFPGGFRSPSSNGIGTIFWLCCAWALAVAVAVRLFFWWVLVQRNILAVVRTVLVFAFFLGIHLVADPGRPSRRSWVGVESSLNDWRFMASLHTLLLIHASFPVALFWDATARPTAQPHRSAATDGRGSPLQRS